MMVRDAKGEIEFIDFRESAPRATNPEEEKDAILASSAMSKVYAQNGTLAKEGEWIFHKNLANTLEKHRARLHLSIINALRREGSVMELEDLASYKAIIRTPLAGTFKGHRVFASPLPTSGASLIAVLNIIEGFSNTNNTALNYHRLTEALKYGFALRTELADPAFTNLTARVDQMISKSYANELRSNISESRTYDYKHYNPKFENKELPGTTHVSAVAPDSSAAAITTTVNLIFGSKIMDPITGILFNDEMDDFSIPHVKNNYDLFPSPANFIAPLKRPLSSTVPTIIELANDGGLLVVGGSGGSRILSSVTQLILNQVDNGLALAASLDSPRLHHQLLPNSIFLEPDFDPLIAKLLESKGHQITWWPKYKSAIQAVARSSDGSISAVSDSRKKGKAAAY
ncbi:hypothetical protein DSO57_1033538 [Entomophthora muscae]|uniref:Uncharacterized protein n=1 Tax=Entomophthora muscae TaxID=34485 RepID=A0ACC2T033_9FUNG|nr:hypothetical protein DSO57_1033538 [Entomophthora muscae]